MDEKKPGGLKNLIDSIGALAEMTAIYRKSLIEQEIPIMEVKQYTAAFIVAAFSNGGGKNGQA